MTRGPSSLQTSSTSIDIAFHQAGKRPTARYVSGAAVCEEALEHGRWIGLYRSATGHVHRENVIPGLPGMDSLKHPLHAFELEMDGQSLHNRWELLDSSRRPGNRPGTTESVIELKHQVRPVTLKVVTRLDGTPVLARYLEITNTGTAPAALGRIAPWSGVLWNTNTEKPHHYSHLNPSFDERGRSKFTLGYMAKDDWGHEGEFVWQSLPQEAFRIERCNWLDGESSASLEVTVKIRHGHPGAEATVTPLENGAAEVRLHVPQRAVTPGQAAVCYAGDRVLGGGWITRRV